MPDIIFGSPIILPIFTNPNYDQIFNNCTCFLARWQDYVSCTSMRNLATAPPPSWLGTRVWCTIPVVSAVGSPTTAQFTLVRRVQRMATLWLVSYGRRHHSRSPTLSYRQLFSLHSASCWRWWSIRQCKCETTEHASSQAIRHFHSLEYVTC